MSNEQSVPYVVSADVSRLMKIWANENGYLVPSDPYFKGMLRDLEQVLSSYFDSVHIVPEKFLANGLSGLAVQTTIPIISLDRAYIDGGLKRLAGFIDITRSVNEDLQSNGLTERPGTPPIDIQINSIVNNLRTNKVALLDDVLFEGRTHSTVAAWLQARGITVEKVLVGIAIRDGAEKLAQCGIDVHSLLSYDAVVDEVCERDFIAGVPLSGRTVVTSMGDVFGAPYLLPFGRPDQWASIPTEYAEDFSVFALAQSIGLWALVEKLNGRSISTSEIPKPVFGLEDNVSVVKALKNVNGKR